MPQDQLTYFLGDALAKPICTECGGSAGYTDNNGLIADGGAGSVRYATTQLIWLVRGDEAAKPGMLCDDCVDGFVVAGKLEAFSTSTGTLPDDPPSEAAYRELFGYGARRAYTAFWKEQGDRPYATRPLDDEGREGLERMRTDMVGGDDFYFSTWIVAREQLADRAIEVGKTHALCAIALGYGEEDPGFETAASQWASLRRAADAEMAKWCADSPSDESLLAALMMEAADEQSSARDGEDQ